MRDTISIQRKTRDELFSYTYTAYAMSKRGKKIWMGKADDNQAQEKTKNDYLLVNDNKIPLAPMGVLAPGSAHARPSARPPLNTSGIFSAHMSEGGRAGRGGNKI